MASERSTQPLRGDRGGGCFRRVISLVAVWRRQRSSTRETQFHRRTAPDVGLPLHDDISTTYAQKNGRINELCFNGDRPSLSNEFHVNLFIVHSSQFM